MGTALPDLQVTQDDAVSYLLENFALKKKALHEKIFGHPSVQTRYFFLRALGDLAAESTDQKAKRFEKAAVALSLRSAQQALKKAGASADEIDFVATTTCTGSLCPGISSYLAGDLPLGAHVRMRDLAGMGCGAALPAIEGAADFLSTQKTGAALVVSTEISSAAFFPGDDPALVVSNALFGDGSAAVILRKGAARRKGLRPFLVDVASVTNPAWREHLRFRVEDGRLRNVLDKHIPEEAGELIDRLVSNLLKRHNLQRSDIGSWIVHAGGAGVLDALSRRLGVPQTAFQFASDVLEGYGNLSSASVLFALERALAVGSFQKGDLGLMLTFGAGFSAHGCLVQFRDA